ncbi:MAG: hypothetical protein EWM50_06365 [Gottschalkiaceae bacterium]|nr:MAG: hypothetical protein EWM50_06365 [Gottschalkiaceae bacterium]
MQENRKVVLLLSGGIDSTVLLYWLIEKNYEVFPLIINYGQVTFEGEYKSAASILYDLGMENIFTVDISEISKLGKGTLIGQYPKDVTSYNGWYNTEFFPNRNIMLLILATSYAYKINASNIAIGVVGASYKDTSLSFLNSFMKCIEISLMPINIIAPFADRQRDEVIKQAIRLNVPIEKTFSCNALSERHCQLCSSCHDREMAFNLMSRLLL